MSNDESEKSSSSYDTVDTDEEKRKNKNPAAKKKKVEQKYRKEWEKQFPWITAVKGNPCMSKCKCCDAHLKCDISVLKTHQSRIKHQNNSTKLNQGSSKVLSQFLAPKTDHVVVEQTKNLELLLAGFFSEHNIPFLASDHLAGRTKITSIVKNVIAPCERETLAQKLCKRRFSVLIDETTDIGTVSTLCIIVRFFDEDRKQIISQFFKLINVFDEATGKTGATAENIYKMLTKPNM
ncbi:uncharacterized protein LOC115883889 [Sitophilus oryzae]|uniref:Uncharacterized protein LOC115883889 n=1 Tax=Sitophilus oryzae TaxID=7048 RepID=A0A6J2Y592_SITOR|nr:uncharacterized protein LOC115883889 [Sitophilus oryzae]